MPARIDASLTSAGTLCMHRRALQSPCGDCASSVRDVSTAMDFSFLFDQTASFFRSDIARVTDTWIPVATICWPPKRADELHRHRQGRCAVVALVSAGPLLTPVRRGSALISWSGSMFEYLMPALVMRSPRRQHAQPDVPASRAPPDRLRNENAVCRGEFRSPRSTPRDLNLTYQYSGFGVPGLGLKRG